MRLALPYVCSTNSYNMKTIILFTSTCFLSINVMHAQLTLTSTDLNPQYGESFGIARSGWINPGSGGTGMTWDLSALTPDFTGTISVLGPDANYPGSTHSLSTTFDDGFVSNEYQTVSSSDQFLHGFTFSGSAATLDYAYTDPQQLMQFPLTLSSSFTDDYSGPFSIAGIDGTRSGTVTYTVDGSGTLITPSGTFQNVLRLRLDNTHTDVSGLGTFTENTTTYLWYKAGIHYPLAYLTEDLNDASYSEGGYLTSWESTSLESIKSEASLLPNPANEIIQIRVDGNTISSVQFTAADGKIVYQSDVEQSEMSVDIHTWEAGIYVVQLTLSNGSTIVKRLMKK